MEAKFSVLWSPEGVALQGQGSFPQRLSRKGTQLDGTGGSDVIKLEPQEEGQLLSLCVLTTSAFFLPPRFPAQDQSWTNPLFLILRIPPHGKGRGRHSLWGTWAPGFVVPVSPGKQETASSQELRLQVRCCFSIASNLTGGAG